MGDPLTKLRTSRTNDVAAAADTGRSRVMGRGDELVVTAVAFPAVGYCY